MKALGVVIIISANVLLILTLFPNLFKFMRPLLGLKPEIEFMHQGSIDGQLVTVWRDKLIGKKLGDVNSDTTFAEADLPLDHRIKRPNTAWAADWKPERLNVRVNAKGKVIEVGRG